MNSKYSIAIQNQSFHPTRKKFSQLKKTKVLFYFNSNSPFYTNLFYSIKRGFEEANCLIEGEPKLLNSNDLRKKIFSFKPDFVLEINRTKSEIVNFPKGVLHVGWLFDVWGKETQDLYSDIIYTFGYNWLNIFPKINAKYKTCLPPATDASIYKALNIKKSYDFSFLGHIPKPWADKELQRIIGYNKNKTLYFKDILPPLEKQRLAKDNTLNLETFQKKHNFTFLKDLETSLLYDIGTRIYRQKNRMHFLNLIEKISTSIVIYGTNWNLYEKYVPYYKGYLDDPSKINEAIQSSKIMLHDNHNFHFRILDAMASGTPVMIASPRKNSDNLELFGLKKNIDYLEIDIFSNSSIEFPHQELETISTNARRNVMQNHLWVHRAQTILDDVKTINENYAELFTNS